MRPDGFAAQLIRALARDSAPYDSRRRAPTTLGPIAAAAAMVLVVTVGVPAIRGRFTGVEPLATPRPVTIPSVSVDATLAAKVPSDIRARGRLVVGVAPTYEPSDFLDADGRTVIGFDVDLFNAVAGKLGMTPQWQSAPRQDMIQGAISAKYDVSVSSLTITMDRLRYVTMVSYFVAGAQWAAKAGAEISADDACGRKVAVRTATVEVDDLNVRSRTCTDAGKAKITIDRYPTLADVTNAVLTGKDDAMIAESPASAYAVKQADGRLRLVGNMYGSTAYGYAVSKNRTDLADVLKQAIEALIADGTYEAILAKWGVQTGGIAVPTVRPPA
ncbi:ABC transporter substrate-binding protein [Paractinoplanes durhamensis]|uniref:ABC transporter substrate-binding protein n=1 Tax=Paractinoplanes durhamensis TaxID=113563 RepID=A0ABQ3Z750_9ACTN|nr:ABC transporter substrate-binding protein [Actinoplanes durhamensis]GIE05655.1 ABC transporter substrate-binding protein [Actinoplanes durhamensis]